MSDLLSELQEWALITNVRAFLRVLRAGESSQDDVAYRLHFGGSTFQSFRDHPRKAITVGRLTSTAAGAYQFLSKTWDGLVTQYGFKDFTPPNQDLGAIALIKGRKALDAVIAGRFDEAVRACSREWASLPGSPYGQPTLTFEKARAVYLKYGGTLASPSTPAVPSEVKTMPIALALLQVFGPALSNLVPQIGKFLSNPDVVSRNLDAAQAIIDTVVGVTQKPDLASAIEAMKSDPALTKEVAQAVVAHPDVLGLVEIGGGISAARDAGLASQNADKPFWFNPVFWMSVLLLPLVYWIVGAVLIGGVNTESLPVWVQAFFKIFGTAFNQETRSGTVNLVIGMVLGGIVGIWFGTSYGSMKKDDTINRQVGK